MPKIQQQRFLQEGEFFDMEIEKKTSTIPKHKYYEMRCLDEGLRDISVVANTASDVLELMYYKLKCERLEREI